MDHEDPDRTISNTLTVILPLHCKRCYAPYGVRVNGLTYEHPMTECSLSDRKYRVDIGTHGQITVVDITPKSEAFIG